MRPARLFGPVCLGLTMVAAGCSNPVDTTENYLPVVAAADDTVPDEVIGECDCIQPGDWFLFDKLEVHSLDGNSEHAVIATLNPLWAADMSKNELNLYLEVVEATATKVEFTVVNGARVDGETSICLLPETATTLTYPRDGCQLLDSDEAHINIYAGSVSNPKNCTNILPTKHAIPVERAVVSTTLSTECTSLESVINQGIIGELELNSICTCLVIGDGLSDTCEDLDPGYDDPLCPGCTDRFISLGVLLPGFDPIDFICETVAGDPAVCLTGAFSAKRIAEPPPDCGL